MMVECRPFRPAFHLNLGTSHSLSSAYLPPSSPVMLLLKLPYLFGSGEGTGLRACFSHPPIPRPTEHLCHVLMQAYACERSERVLAPLPMAQPHIFFVATVFITISPLRLFTHCTSRQQRQQQQRQQRQQRQGQQQQRQLRQ